MHDQIINGLVHPRGIIMHYMIDGLKYPPTRVLRFTDILLPIQISYTLDPETLGCRLVGTAIRREHSPKFRTSRPSLER